MESLALLATPTCHAIAERRRKLGEGGSGVERVDDIFGYDRVARASRVLVLASRQNELIPQVVGLSLQHRDNDHRVGG